MPVHEIEHDHFEDTEAEIELIAPDGSSFPVAMYGPSEMHVYFEGERFGVAVQAELLQAGDWLPQAEARGGSLYTPVLASPDPRTGAYEMDLPDGSFLLTFDDGFLGVYEYAVPVLRDLGWPATVFLVSQRIGGRDDWCPD